MRERAVVLRALRAIGLAFAIAAPTAFAAVGVNKTFNPTNVSAGQPSTLTVILLNNNAAAATGTAFTDTLPGTVVVATPANTTTSCGGDCDRDVRRRQFLARRAERFRPRPAASPASAR